MVICLGRGADLHMAQLMPLPLTVSCFSKIQICFTFLVMAHLGSPGQMAVKWLLLLLLAGVNTSPPLSNLRRARHSSADKTSSKLLGSHSPSMLSPFKTSLAE